MTELKQIYKCMICGNIVEVLHAGKGILVCCGKNMILQEEKTFKQEGNEKHVPIIERDKQGVIIKIGSKPHPMDKNHYIEWIEISTNKGTSKKFLQPGDEPNISFPVIAKNVKARAYCNVHGLWKSN